jgi:hypothetical protein
MAEPFADWVVAKIGQTAGLYHRLIIVVAPAGGGKTVALRGVCERTGFPLINLNLELSSKMLDQSECQRVLQLPRLLSEIMNNSGLNVIPLDNIEILFEVSLKQDPFRLFEEAGGAADRNKKGSDE